MVTSYDVAGLGELVEHMDIMHVPPEHTLFEYPAPQAQEPHLYILDTGFVSTAMDVQHMHHKQTGDQKMLRHRLAKHGTGATSRPSTRPPTRPPGATRPTPCLLVRQARCSAWRAS